MYFIAFRSSSCFHSIPRFLVMSIEIFRYFYLFMILFLNFVDLNFQLHFSLSREALQEAWIHGS